MRRFIDHCIHIEHSSTTVIFFTFPCNYHTCMDIDVEIIEYINLNNYNNLLYILSMCMYPWDWYIDLFSIVLY